MSNDQIVEYLSGLEKEQDALREESLRLGWWMRGSISYDDSMLLSSKERKIIQKIIKDNVEMSKKAGTPIF